MTQPSLARFQTLLRELFQFESADLDFGLYRILKAKRGQINNFIEQRLPEIVAEAFAEYGAEEREALAREAAQKREQIASVMDEEPFDDEGNYVLASGGGEALRQYRMLRETLAEWDVAETLRQRVYNDLYTFFSRYYEEGDFIPKRRVGRNKPYMVPYEGEEVLFHWANRDQYYVKSGEYFRSYRWQAGDVTVEFALRNAQTEQNNNRSRDRRYFVLAAKEAVQWEAEARQLTAFFEYRPLTEKEQKQHGRKAREGLNQQAYERVLAALPDQVAARLAQPRQRGEREVPVLAYHLDRFTRLNTTDFFIHKNLRGFLEDELDFFLKNEVLKLDELLGGAEEDLHRHLRRARVVRRVAEAIIDFLAQIEDFQKRLWEKRKFVVRTEYALTVDHLLRWEDDVLLDAVLESEAQHAEWQDLYALDELLAAEAADAPLLHEGLDRTFLQRHPTLVVDTRHFDEAFTWRLLSHVEDLDAALDGLLLKSENFQALNLLLPRYREQVKAIYIDPPYNTGGDDFVYKDNYQHSSWLSLLVDRFILSRSMLANDGIAFVNIDDNEQSNLRLLMNLVFGDTNFVSTIIWQKMRSPKNAANYFSDNHDYLLCFARNKEDWRPTLLERTAAADSRYANPDNDPRGVWTSGDLLRKEARDYAIYPITVPSGRVVTPPPGTSWRVNEDEFERLCEDNRIWFGEEGGNVPRLKRFLTEVKQGITPTTIWLAKEVGDNQKGKVTFRRLFYDTAFFETPKAVGLLKKAFHIGTSKDDADSPVLDFFAGSGTTAHAVINLNREDGGNRRYILVEMGAHFDAVLLPRIKKVVFAERWKDGKPVRQADGFNGTSHFLQYYLLEQYEDTMNNLEVTRGEAGQQAMDLLGDPYLLRYMLAWETQGSPSLLNVEELAHPFRYKLRVREGDETVERPVDLVSTFNYLLGLRVQKLRAFEDGERPYRGVLGQVAEQQVVVVWRPTADLVEDEAALARDRDFITGTILPALLPDDDIPLDRLLANGPCLVVPDGFSVEAIEPIFRQRMWAEVL